MRRLFTLCLILVLSTAVNAQNATYNLRFADPIVNYSNYTFFFSVEIKSNSESEQFFMADQSICFEFNADAFVSDYAQLASSNISGLVLQDDFQTISLFSAAAINVTGTTVCYDVQLINGDGFYVPFDSWSRIANFTLAISDISQLANISFNTVSDLPPTIVKEKIGGLVLDADEGTINNIVDMSFSNLPIELSYFEAEVNRSNKVELSWQTLSESGNESFTIERSSDGNDYKAIGQLAGAGNSTDVIDYLYIDEEPLLGKSYYRLKQTDFNGEFEYSEVATAFVAHKFEETIVIYPNPVKEQFNLNFQEFPGNDLLMQIFNMDGRLVHSENLKISDGTILETIVFVDGLPSGNYQVRITGEEDTGYAAFGRFIKL